MTSCVPLVTHSKSIHLVDHGGLNKPPPSPFGAEKAPVLVGPWWRIARVKHQRKPRMAPHGEAMAWGCFFLWEKHILRFVKGTEELHLSYFSSCVDF
jgi:hypothetical protein